tara:strand:- start:458 stop:649 length:192 start_codon:yes stop_codon:yes gene_type:complete
MVLNAQPGDIVYSKPALNFKEDEAGDLGIVLEVSPDRTTFKVFWPNGVTGLARYSHLMRLGDE